MKPLDEYLLLERKRGGSCDSDERGDLGVAMEVARMKMGQVNRDYLAARPRVPGICPDHGWHGGWCMVCRMVRK